MTGGKCARCGAEDSMFWYPYGFGMATIPSVADRNIDRCQYFMLCDDCQKDFVDFMRKSGPWLDPEKLKKLVDEMKPVIVPEVKE